MTIPTGKQPMDDTPRNTPPAAAEPAAERRLRLAAADAIRSGRMPSHSAGRIWGGSGSGRACPICCKPVEEKQFEIEMEFVPNGTQWRVMHLHVQCCSAWESARRDFPGGRAPHAPVQAMPGSSANGVSLRAAADDITIGGRERHHEVRREPAR
jgi:hypothetical protein